MTQITRAANITAAQITRGVTLRMRHPEANLWIEGEIFGLANLGWQVMTEHGIFLLRPDDEVMIVGE